MWMGDYPELPAKDLKTGEELHKIVDKNKEQLLGKNCIEKFGGVLPFLPKVGWASPPVAVTVTHCGADSRFLDPLDREGIAPADPSQ